MMERMQRMMDRDFLDEQDAFLGEEARGGGAGIPDEEEFFTSFLGFSPHHTEVRRGHFGDDFPGLGGAFGGFGGLGGHGGHDGHEGLGGIGRGGFMPDERQFRRKADIGGNRNAQKF